MISFAFPTFFKSDLPLNLATMPEKGSYSTYKSRLMASIAPVLLFQETRTISKVGTMLMTLALPVVGESFFASQAGSTWKAVCQLDVPAPC